MPIDDWDVDLIALRALQLLENKGSISRVADVLGVTQQALSSRILRFENKVGANLVFRNKRGASLSESGVVVVGWARKVLEEIDTFESLISTLDQANQPTIKMAASMTIAEYLLPRWLSELKNVTPSKPKFELQVGNSVQVIRKVKTGEVQLGFIETPDFPSDLEIYDLGDDPVVLVVEPQHKWAKLQIDLETLSRMPLLVREEGSGTRRTIEAALEKEGLLLSIEQSLPTTGAIRSTVVIPGSSPAVLSRLTVADDLLAGRLVEVQVAGLSNSRRLAAIWQSQVNLSPISRDLLSIASKAEYR